MRAPKRVDRTEEHFGILVSGLPVRILEISRTGCLLEAARRVDVGTLAEFRIDIGGRTYSEELRVARAHRVEGAGSTYRMGAEFLRTRRAGESSLRRALYATLAAPPLGGPVGSLHLILISRDR